jgi:hypothetical protein
LNFLISDEGNLINTSFCISSLPTIVADHQADLINFPFENGVTSKLKTFIHSGISFSCFLFHALIGDFSQVKTSSPTTAHFQERTYLFSQSA